MQTSVHLRDLFQWIRPGVPQEYQERAVQERFQRNIRRILVMSVALFLEQAAYGALVAVPGSLLQTVYFATSGITLITAVISSWLLVHSPAAPRAIHHVFEYSPVAIAMTIALVRTAILSAEVFRLPTIYIAIIYVVAVVFILPVSVSFIFYLLVSIGAVVVIPEFHPTITESSYVADIMSNGAIAWIISTIAYRSFISDFLKTRTIEEKNRELEELSVRDRLTGLVNRRKLDSVLEEVHAWSARYGAEYALILVDIDHFKLVNDNRGHHAGDVVLREIAGVLANSVREVDTCGRWGGEEFLIICPETDLVHAQALAERLRGIVEARSAGDDAPVTASFGVASSQEATDAENLIRIADDRLYLAKERGRNRVVSA
ncbi:MAG: GGDEF domain-containing protein [Alkalispirochaeta sp.]